MNDKQVFWLGDLSRRKQAAEACIHAPNGWVATIAPDNRSSAQNRLLHDALTDIAEQVEWHGKKLPMDVWKRLCTAAWLREIGESPEMVPAIDGRGFDVIFERTSKLSVAQMTSLIEWITAFGTQNGVTFGKLGTT